MNTRSHTEISLHLAWATKHRQPLLTGEVERFVHAAIRRACLREKCAPLAVDGVDDHVHATCRTKGTMAPSKLAERLKRLSSGQVTARLGIEFEWQEEPGGRSARPMSRRACVGRCVRHVIEEEHTHRRRP